MTRALTPAEAFKVASGMEADLHEIRCDAAIIILLADSLVERDEMLSRALARLGYGIHGLAEDLEKQRLRISLGLHHHAFPKPEAAP